MSTTHEHNHRPEHPPGEEVVGLLTHDVLKEQLNVFRRLNGDALINTLVPHRDLPDFSVARYLIAQNAGENGPTAELNEAYDLGVVFARSLVIRALPEGRDLPVITEEFNAEGKQLVDRYLDESRKRPLHKLTRRLEDRGPYADIDFTVNWFADHCQQHVPHLMFNGGKDAIMHGFHDYISAVTLIEAPAETRRTAFSRLLGGLGITGRMHYGGHRPERA